MKLTLLLLTVIGGLSAASKNRYKGYKLEGAWTEEVIHVIFLREGCGYYVSLIAQRSKTNMTWRA